MANGVDFRIWSKRVLAASIFTVAAVAATATSAYASSSHQFARLGNGVAVGEVWYNSGTCCIPQRNSFTMKDWYTDGWVIHVQWSGARTGSRSLADGGGREVTFSIETGNVPRAAIQWRSCVVDVITGLNRCGTWITDYID